MVSPVLAGAACLSGADDSETSCGVASILIFLREGPSSGSSPCLRRGALVLCSIVFRVPRSPCPFCYTDLQRLLDDLFAFDVCLDHVCLRFVSAYHMAEGCATLTFATC